MRLDHFHNIGGNREYQEVRGTRLALEKLAAAFERLAVVAEKLAAPPVPAELHDEIGQTAEMAAQVKDEMQSP